MSAGPPTRADTVLPPLKGGVEQWQDWMTALDDGLDPPPKRSAMMHHGNHSSPSLRQSPPKRSNHLAAYAGDDGLGLDKLRIADDSFTPPARTAASLPPEPGPAGDPSSSEMRRGSTRSYHSAQEGSLDDGEDQRPMSGDGQWQQQHLDDAYDEARGSFGSRPPSDPSGSGYYPQLNNGYPQQQPYFHPGQVEQQQQQQQFGYQYGQQPGLMAPPPPPAPGQFYAPPQGYGYAPPPPGFDPYGSLNRAPSTVSASSAPSFAHANSMTYPRTGTNLSAASGSGPSSSRRTDTRTPISKASIDEYRNRIKNDPDPEAHFNFAKFLIEAARRLASGNAAGDTKAIKKYRDTLLQESLKLIKRLATQGVGVGKPAYADAQFFLANCLGNGSLGLAVDHEKAYNLYVQASKQNHPQATFRTAVCNELGAGTRKDPNRAVLFFRKASALGDTAGMYKLGMILLNGMLGQQRNPKEALLWLKRAAQQADEDNPHSLHELGMLYEKPPVVGVGPTAQLLVPHDEAYARELFTQAAQLGYAPSQNRLGSCYEYGSLTCPIDPRRSIAWYTRAAERGDAESELALSGWYLTGSEGVLKQSDSEAYLWARRAANKGLPKAEYAVGYYSEVGIGVKQDLDESKRWYMRAASNGNKRAMQRLAELKRLGAQKPGKRNARPTRDQAASECIIS